MSTTVNQAFIKQFEREVHESFQRMGSKLRHTVRVVNDVKGSTAVFQKVGKGTASTKSTHGLVPVMNLDHSAIECELKDFYAGDWVDHLDELKINIDERQVIANAGAYALGRKSDELIINVLSSGSITGNGTTLFNTYFVPLVQEQVSAGYDDVLAPTTIARNWSGSSTDIAEKEAERLIYNQLVRDNAATYGYTVVDFASIEGSLNRPDGTHPDPDSHETMALFIANIINNL